MLNASSSECLRDPHAAQARSQPGEAEGSARVNRPTTHTRMPASPGRHAAIPPPNPAPTTIASYPCSEPAVRRSSACAPQFSMRSGTDCARQSSPHPLHGVYGSPASAPSLPARVSSDADLSGSASETLAATSKQQPIERRSRLAQFVVGVATKPRVSPDRFRESGMPQNFLGCDREQAFLMPPDPRDWLRKWSSPVSVDTG
jgi:hypothetical protein